jgi:uncharacterized membrane protein YGL010W
MLAGRPWSAWIEDYGRSHMHPLNQRLHLVGIPLIVLSLPLALGAWFSRLLGPVALVLFLLGWALQFIGHAIERRPPEFLRDPRYLLVGVRWWCFKIGNRGVAENSARPG